MTEHTSCLHPFGDHLMIAFDELPIDGVLVCVEPGCVCVTTWAVGTLSVRQQRALNALQGAYRTLRTRRLLPVLCACGETSWNPRDIGYEACASCQPRTQNPELEDVQPVTKEG